MLSGLEFKNVLSKYRNDLKNLKREATRLQQDILKKLSINHLELPYKFNDGQEAKAFSQKYFSKKEFGQEKNSFSQKYFSKKELVNYNNDELIELLGISSTLLVNIKLNFKIIDDILNLTDSTSTLIGGNISECMWLLNYLYLKYQFNIRALSELFGMVIKNNANALKVKSFKVDYPEEIIFLSNYYNNDGTFKIFTSSDALKDNEEFKKYITNFKNFLEKIKVKDFDVAFVMNPEEEKASLDFTGLIIALTNLLKDDCFKNEDQRIKRNQDEILSKLPKEKEIKEDHSKNIEVKVIKEEKIDSKEALKYVCMFYEDGFLINIPTDLDQFLKYLDACDIPSLEKIYIGNTLLSIKDDEVIFTLEEKDIRRYLKILQVLNKMNFNSDLYFKLREERNSLLEAKELLNEAHNQTDLAIIRESQTETLNNLENIIRQYLEENKEKNNLIFLNNETGKTYLEDDLINNPWLYDDFKQLLTNLLNGKKILERISDVKDVNMPIYMVSNNQASLYLVEVMLGIYVVVGLTLTKDKRKNIQNRIFRSKEILEQYQENLFDYRRKNEILQHNLTLKQKFEK